MSIECVKNPFLANYPFYGSISSSPRNVISPSFTANGHWQLSQLNVKSYQSCWAVTPSSSATLCRGVTRKHRLHPASTWQTWNQEKKKNPPFSLPAVLKVTCPPRGRGLMSRSHISPPPTVTLSCHFQTGTELISQALLPRWHLKNWRVFCWGGDGREPMFYIWLENTLRESLSFFLLFFLSVSVVACLYSWKQHTSNESLSESPGCTTKYSFPEARRECELAQHLFVNVQHFSSDQSLFKSTVASASWNETTASPCYKFPAIRCFNIQLKILLDKIQLLKKNIHIIYHFQITVSHCYDKYIQYEKNGCNIMIFL